MKMPPKISILALLIAGFSCVSSQADLVAEWKFDNTADLSTGDTLKLDQAAPNASTESTLTGQTSYSTAETGLGDKWQPFLRAGYIDVGAGRDNAGYGLVTKNTAPPEDKKKNNSYARYLGFRGLGKDGHGGTLYLVFSPKDSWTRKGSRQALFGTGVHPFQKYVDAGWVRLAREEDGVFALTLGRGDGEKKLITQAKVTDDTMHWDLGKWYFIAASWQQGAAPVLYVREMSPEGSAASPSAAIGQVEGDTLIDTTEPSATALAIGSFLGDHGNGEAAVDGAGGLIAYAALENAPATREEMEKKFQELAKH